MATIKGDGIKQGDLVSFLTNTSTLANELKSDVDVIKAALGSMLAKMDSDAGITDADYASLYAQGGSAASPLPADVSANDLSLTV